MSAKLCLPALALAFVTATPALAAPETFQVDTDHTFPSLEFPHMGISVWRGKFNKSSGTIVLDRKARTGTVDIKIDPASIDFGHQAMNEHARGEDWLNVAKYPEAAYKGTIKFKGATPNAVDGELTFMGVTRPVKLKINSFKCIEHPFYKREACGADAEGQMHRGEFGLTKGAEGEAGKVTLRIQIEALKP